MVNNKPGEKNWNEKPWWTRNNETISLEDFLVEYKIRHNNHNQNTYHATVYLPPIEDIINPTPLVLTPDEINHLERNVEDFIAQNPNTEQIAEPYNSYHNTIDDAVTNDSDYTSSNPVKKFIPVGTLSGGLLLLAACGGGGVPAVTESPVPTPTTRAVASPTNTPEIIIDFKKLSTPTIPTKTFDNTYDAIFHFHKPSSEFQEFLYNKFVVESKDVKRYMQAINADKDFNYKDAMIKFVSDVFGGDYLNFIPDTIDLFTKAYESAKLKNDFYIPLESFQTFQMGDIINQTEVSVTPIFFFEDELKQKIPLGALDDLVMNEESYNRLKQEFESSGQVTVSSDWAKPRGENNSGYINVDINLPLEKEWEIDMGVDSLSRSSIFEDKLYVGTKTGSFYALSTQDADIEWKLRMGFYLKEGKTPAATRDMVFFSGGPSPNRLFLYAIDSTTGEEIWRQSMRRPEVPIIDGNELYIVDDYTSLQSRNPETGELIWQFTANGFINEMPVFENDAIYFTSVERDSSGKYRDVGVYSVSRDGTLNWKDVVTPNFTTLDEISDSGNDDRIGVDGLNVNPPVILADNYLIWMNAVAAFTEDCILGFDIRTRESVLNRCGLEESLYGRYSEIATDGKEVYFGHNKTIFRFRVDENGLSELPPINLDSRVYDLLITNNILFAGTEKNLLAIDRKNINDVNIIDSIVSHNNTYLTFSDGSLYFTSLPSNTIYKFSPTSK